MLTIRTFKHRDQRSLLEIWNRKAQVDTVHYRHLSAEYLEEHVLNQHHFDSHGLFLAMEDSEPVGFAHAAFGPNSQQTDIDIEVGVICLVMVVPEYPLPQRVMRDLVAAGEHYLTGRGAKIIYGGASRPCAPFYMGLYGGSEPLGVFDSDSELRSVFQQSGYHSVQRTCRFYRNLVQSKNCVFPQTFQWAQRLQLRFDHSPTDSHWWQACMLCHFTWLDIIALDRQTHQKVGTARFRLMTTIPSETVISSQNTADSEQKCPQRICRYASLMNVEILPELHHKGVGTFLLGEAFKTLRSREFEVDFVEAQAAADDIPLRKLLERVGFELKESGDIFLKNMTFSPFRTIYQDILDGIRAEGLHKEERILSSPQNRQVQVADAESATPKPVLNLCANNYLGLSDHPVVVAAAHAALDSHGYGLSSVRFICGTQDIHRQLETKIACFLGMEDAVLFGSCFDANGALFETILTAEDAIFSDKLVHASIIDGIRLSKAQRNIFEHSNMEQLEAKLRESQARIKLIMTDGVFSMDGDMAKLDIITNLAEKYGALVAVDDSHATGFIGKTGRGTHEYFDVMDKVDIISTTFGKALGGATGGCIAARKEIVALLKQRGRPYLFSNSLMPAVTNATLAVLDLLATTTERRDRLEKSTEYWRTGLIQAGFDIKLGNTPIVPIMLYEAKVAQEFSRRLFEAGILAVGFFYPVVPKDEARIRTQISAAHERTDLDFALEVFTKIGKELNVICPPR